MVPPFFINKSSPFTSKLLFASAVKSALPKFVSVAPLSGLITKFQESVSYLYNSPNWYCVPKLVTEFGAFKVTPVAPEKLTAPAPSL